MNHDVAVQQNATERYLLNELNSEDRDEFEEHFFECHECARDVRAGTLFLEKGTKSCFEPVDQDVNPNPHWFASLLNLRPAYAYAAFVLLLPVIGYQSWSIHTLNQPQVLASTFFHLNTYSDDASPQAKLVAHAGQALLLQFQLTSVPTDLTYKGDLYNPAGGVELSLPLPAPTDGMWSIQIPRAQWKKGIYHLIVFGVTASGREEKVGEGSFELITQN